VLGLPGEPCGRILEGRKDLRWEMMGVEDRRARLQRRRDSSFERHDWLFFFFFFFFFFWLSTDDVGKYRVYARIEKGLSSSLLKQTIMKHQTPGSEEIVRIYRPSEQNRTDQNKTTLVDPLQKMLLFFALSPRARETDEI
jgi:hypothetical protein